MAKQDLREQEEQPKEPEVQVSAGESRNEQTPVKKKKTIQKKFSKFMKGK